MELGPTEVVRRPAHIPAPCPYRVAKGRENLLRTISALIVLTGCLYTWGINSRLEVSGFADNAIVPVKVDGVAVSGAVGPMQGDGE